MNNRTSILTYSGIVKWAYTSIFVSIALLILFTNVSENSVIALIATAIAYAYQFTFAYFLYDFLSIYKLDIDNLNYGDFKIIFLLILDAAFILIAVFY